MLRECAGNVRALSPQHRVLCLSAPARRPRPANLGPGHSEMANQIILFGMIEDASLGRESRNVLQERNVEVISQLPVEDEFPWLTRGMFALPSPSPQGTFREQIIHFGLSMKDRFLSPSAVYGREHGWPPEDRAHVTEWIGKFEDLLRRLYCTARNCTFGPKSSLTASSATRRRRRQWDRCSRMIPGRSLTGISRSPTCRKSGLRDAGHDARLRRGSQLRARRGTAASLPGRAALLRRSARRGSAVR